MKRNFRKHFLITAAGATYPHPVIQRWLQAHNLGKVALAAQYAEEIEWLLAHDPTRSLPDTTPEFNAFRNGGFR